MPPYQRHTIIGDLRLSPLDALRIQKKGNNAHVNNAIIILMRQFIAVRDNELPSAFSRENDYKLLYQCYRTLQ